MNEMRVYNFIASWTDLADGVVGIFTLGFYRPAWDFKFMIWHSKKTLERRRERDAALEEPVNT
jgi:hypothetical protein